MRFSWFEMTLVCDYNEHTRKDKKVAKRIIEKKKKDETTIIATADAAAVAVCDKRINEKSNGDEHE